MGDFNVRTKEPNNKFLTGWSHFKLDSSALEKKLNGIIKFHIVMVVKSVLSFKKQQLLFGIVFLKRN